MLLKPNVLHQILNQANTNGAIATVLLDKNGLLIASAGEGCEVMSAVLSNIWTYYEKSENILELIMIEQEKDKIVLCKVTPSLLLAIRGDNTAEFGFLKIKLKKLKEYLRQPLMNVMECDRPA
ncbi:ragulator complex protein LAMTOR2 homolog [Schistocerca gregaria]|uniref:ragulator complex protein LAMTOR2 homolog n=1 Tax=Schistocerca gregaria TaxID=7010 RepID=UPI00211F0E0E|nr:ragulator complex protein LAMTOR2 homolog [Schistocerca gregaria]